MVSVTTPVPKRWAKNCCSNASPKTNRNGMDKIAGMGGYTTKNLPCPAGMSSESQGGFSVR